MSRKEIQRNRSLLTGMKLAVIAVLAVLFFAEPLKAVQTNQRMQSNGSVETTGLPDTSAIPTEALRPTLTPVLTPTSLPEPPAADSLPEQPELNVELASTPEPTPFPLEKLTPLGIEEQVKAALLMECESETLFYEYKINDIIYPASVTKLMTALLALENGNLSDEIKVNASALKLDVDNAIRVWYEAGDTMTLETALYGTLLPSGNDAAAVVAEHIAGSVEEFVALMTHRAMELGMKSTNFCNPHGLPDERHVTTAWDISLLMKELFSQEQFFEISSQKSHTVSYRNKNAEEVKRTYQNTNQYMAGKYALPEGITILGGKTGTTTEAGKCLVMYVQSPDGKTYLAEVFGAESYEVLYDCMTKLLNRILEAEASDENETEPPETMN